MIEELKPYSTYKDSQVDWLGKVPDHWHVLPNRAIFKEILDRGYPSEQMLSVTISRGVVPQEDLLGDSSKKDSSNDDKGAYKLLQPGDIAYNKMRAWQGAVGASEYRGIISPAYVIMRPRAGMLSRYFHYLLRTPAFAAEAERWSYGITSDQWSLRAHHFKMIYLVVPSLPEQAAIVRFLDHADRRIQRAIRAKKRLIELLNEQKAAIIHQAVTRGLDPDVPMKPSGVEWLGEVPGHWQVVRLRNLARHITSGSRGWSDYAAQSGPLFIRVGNLTRNSIDLDLSDVIRLNLPPAVRGETLRTRVLPNDILLSITAFIGSVAVPPADIGEAFVSQHVACCRLNEGSANPRWIAYVLLSPVGQTHGSLSMYGGTKQGLSLEDVKNYLLLLPPLHEQELLVRRIDDATAVLRRLEDSVSHEISVLQELRARLITDVVTGKLDVRSATGSLPKSLDELRREDKSVEEMDEAIEDLPNKVAV